VSISLVGYGIQTCGSSSPRDITYLAGAGIVVIPDTFVLAIISFIALLGVVIALFGIRSIGLHIPNPQVHSCNLYIGIHIVSYSFLGILTSGASFGSSDLEELSTCWGACYENMTCTFSPDYVSFSLRLHTPHTQFDAFYIFGSTDVQNDLLSGVSGILPFIAYNPFSLMFLAPLILICSSLSMGMLLFSLVPHI